LGAKLGVDFFAHFCPGRADAGQRLFQLHRIAVQFAPKMFFGLVEQAVEPLVDCLAQPLDNTIMKRCDLLAHEVLNILRPRGLNGGVGCDRSGRCTSGFFGRVMSVTAPEAAAVSRFAGHRTPPVGATLVDYSTNEIRQGGNLSSIRCTGFGSYRRPGVRLCEQDDCYAATVVGPASIQNAHECRSWRTSAVGLGDQDQRFHCGLPSRRLVLGFG
jgi:hypothetical protein